MNQKTLMAIDPGASGGIAVEWWDGKRDFYPLPHTDSEVHEMIVDLFGSAGMGNAPAEACLEKVGGFVGKGQPGSTMFTFGRGVGVIVGILIALGVPFEEVRPQEWQKAVGAGTTNGRTKSQWKRHLRDIAQKRNPGHKITLQTADAALMLDYIKSKYHAHAR